MIGPNPSRILDAPRVGPDEPTPAAVDALGGEVVRLRSRDGLRLHGRWLPASREAGDWQPEPHEAILLLHGWTGSIAPDLVELGPSLRRTAGVLGLDFRGHGESEPAQTTWGLREVDDVAGALAWLGERGIQRVAIVGSSMGGITAIASVVVLGDGSLASADIDPAAPASSIEAPRPRIIAIVAESVPPDLLEGVANRIRRPLGRRLRRAITGRLFARAAAVLGGDPRATEPIRIVALVEPVRLLLIHGSADTTVPLKAGRRLAAAAGPSAEHWVVDGAEHAAAHATAPDAWDERVGEFLQRAFDAARPAAGFDPVPVPIIGTPIEPADALAGAGVALGGGTEGD